MTDFLKSDLFLSLAGGFFVGAAALFLAQPSYDKNTDNLARSDAVIMESSLPG